jgi:tRNA threonylcarbamoyladenosine biosynthesis protein TsaB
MLSLAPGLLQAGLAVPADEALPLYIRDKVAKTTQERLLEKANVAVAVAVAARAA